MLPYLSLALYIISLVASLILMLTAKGRKSVNSGRGLRWFKLAATIHVLFFLLFCLQRLMNANPNPAYLFSNLSFLLFFCTGTALCGWAMRTSIPLFIKIYFFLFDASLVLFILMPFQFSGFLLSGSFSQSNEIKYPVNDHFYITEQGNVAGHAIAPLYRVVKHRGMFNQTVQYNLSFGGVLDSIHVLNIVNDKSAMIRGFYKKDNSPDSTDLEIKLKQQPKNEIQRKI